MPRFEQPERRDLRSSSRSLCSRCCPRPCCCIPPQDSLSKRDRREPPQTRATGKLNRFNLFFSTQSNQKNYWISDSSAVSGFKIRMHARRTRNRRIHYWPNRPLRPIADDNAAIAAAVGERKGRQWRGATRPGPQKRQPFSV